MFPSHSRVHIVTDSASDLSPAEAYALGATVVPATVYFGEQAYLDGVDLTPEQFFAMLSQSPRLPRTQPPDTGRFYAAYLGAAARGATAILSLHTSLHLSQAVVAAQEAARLVDPRLPITIVDSMQGTTGLLPAVRFASQMARVGAPLEAITAAVRDVLSRTRLYFLVETLEYLQRGGRIGRAQRLVGTLLDAKPILTIQDGVVAPVETVRPRERAYGRLCELVRELGALDEVYVGQTSDALGQDLSLRLGQLVTAPILRRWVGPGVGTHMGVGVTVAAVTAAQRTRLSMSA